MDRFLHKILFVLWLTIYLPGFSQTFDFENFSVKEGLVQSNVNDILQDRKGYLWFATDGGVSRFDGKSFHNYSTQDSLAETKVTCMLQLPSGEIWMGHSNGEISIYDHEKFSHFRLLDSTPAATIFSFYYTKDGHLWICTIGAGAIQLNPGKKTLQNKYKIYSAEKGLSQNVYRIYEDKKGELFAITDLGIKVSGKNKVEFVSFKALGFPLYEFTYITEDNKGQLWFGTHFNGIVSYNQSTGKVTNYTSANGLPSDFISCLYTDISGNAWAGTWGGGVCEWTGSTFKTFNESSGLAGNKVRCITEDRENNIWIGLNDRGAACYKGERFITYSTKDGLGNDIVNSIVQDDAGRYWMGNNSGITVYDIYKRENCFANILPGGKGAKQVTALKKFKEHIAASTISGDIFYFNSADQKIINQFKTNLVINTIEFDQNEGLWIGSATGLMLYNSITKVLEPVKDPAVTEGDIACLLRDSKNRMWIGMRDKGLVVYDGKKYKRFSAADGLTHNSSTSICEDKNGTIWIGSEGGGIFKYDGGKFKNINSTAGLLSDYVTLLVSPGRDIWIGTNLGLCRFNPAEQKFTTYGRQDGFRAIETRSNAGYCDTKGHLWFGTNSGVTCYNPFADQHNKIEPLTYITSFEVSSVKQPLLPDVKLNYMQNDIRLNFIAITFSAPHKTRYQYMLDGFDDAWQTTEQSFADYPNLPPGEYTFNVKAVNPEASWNSKAQVFSFVIAPPIIKTWWFRTLAILFIMTIIYIYYQTRLNGLRAEKQRELAEQAKYYEEQFLANMSHEIRTPLNATIGMTNLLLDKNPRPDQLGYLKAMKQSSQNLLVIINDILDLSKIQAGKIELETIPFKLHDAIDNVRSTLSFKAEEKGLELKTCIDDNVPAIIIGDPVRLSQVILNLSGNAIKFTGKGSVTISCRLLNIENDTSQIEFKIADTGIGIAGDKLDRVFDSFSQATTDTTRKYGGTGLGLSISKNLVELQGGKISVTSTLNEGTVFSFALPFKISTEPEITGIKVKSGEEARRQLTGLRILLAEDNVFNQMVAVDTLQSLIPGAEVDVAENGKEAIEKIQQKMYDVVMMDIQMPVMDGIEATQYIRKKMLSPNKDIKIIALSAGATKAEVAFCFDAGVNDYIAKPFNPEELLSRLSTLFVDTASAKV